MLKDNSERRSYRKSPGRQYGYEYNPLHGQRPAETSPLDETWNGDGAIGRHSRPAAVLSPRPDPRRTRQLMRQNILASKSHADLLDPVEEADILGQEAEADFYARSHVQSRRAGAPARPYNRQRYQEQEEEQIAEDWIKHGESMPDYLDPDEGYEDDPLEERMRQVQPRLPAPRTRILDEEEEDQLLEAELAEKKRKASRRKLILSALALGGAGLAAYEIVPRLPQAIGSGAANIENQLQQAFNNGVVSGTKAAEKALLNGLDNIEGFSLESAIDAAKLTRIAYDVFVNPLVTLAATVADDFLTVTLDALITGRKWLAQINEDSPTLAALQTVLQTWVQQASEMPEQIQSITETELDGAQSYLRALQQKIQSEQAQLNGQVTPTAVPKTSPTAKP
jgi:hypothetical protein